MQNLSDDANIYLIPASSAEDEQLIEMCLKSGLDQTTVDNLGVDSLEGQIDLADFSSLEDNKFIKKLKKKNNNISGNLTEQNAELLDKYSEIVKSAENDFRLLRESSYQTDEGSIKCWPINQSNKEQYGFTKGDLLLFYTGDGFYRWAGIFEKDHVLPDLIKLILKDPNRKRSYFLELSNLRQIQLDSSVMAELTGRDLDSVQKISPLSGAAKGGIINHFGSLSEFVDEALSGINTLLSYSEQATSDVWDTTESKTADSDTESGAEISESPPTGGQQQTGAVDVGQSETVEQDTTTFVDSKEDSKNKWQDLAQQLHQSKQVVMVGPQGTGKRRVVANLLSNWVEERGRVSKKKQNRSRTIHRINRLF